eukprot:gene9105-18866_t
MASSFAFNCFQKSVCKYKFTELTILSMSSVSYPTTIKNVVSKMTSATQSALQQRISRMEIELPPGVDFGLDVSKKREGRLQSDATPTEKNARSNRDAARLIAEMFSSISSSIVALFPTSEEARLARDLWAPLFRGQVMSIDTPVVKGMGKLPRSRRFTDMEQEQALLSTDGVYIPDGTDVLIIVGARAKDLSKIRIIHDKLGDDTLVILLNTRLDVLLLPSSSTTNNNNKNKSKNKSNTNTDVDNDNDSTSTSTSTSSHGWIREVFRPVFHYAPPILPPNPSTSTSTTDRELLLYYEFNSNTSNMNRSNWFLAEKQKASPQGLGQGLGAAIGQGLSGLVGGGSGSGSGFKTVLETPIRPSALEMFTSLQQNNNNNNN